MTSVRWGARAAHFRPLVCPCLTTVSHVIRTRYAKGIRNRVCTLRCSVEHFACRTPVSTGQCPPGCMACYSAVMCVVRATVCRSAAMPFNTAPITPFIAGVPTPAHTAHCRATQRVPCPATYVVVFCPCRSALASGCRTTSCIADPSVIHTGRCTVACTPEYFGASTAISTGGSSGVRIRSVQYGFETLPSDPRGRVADVVSDTTPACTRSRLWTARRDVFEYTSGADGKQLRRIKTAGHRSTYDTECVRRS
ncbi:hypothetical protein SAMN05445060_4101 [Williamsia sterculiae]|uniref:Uncharacterized protein n=1 Tax=Williamsia sterculiae TaxID=1344003 RepID=A0A1N7HEZ8_9NOCA|nr:hypothetical protein SAMN05445060_4101 [Williamsia sterculiae]